MKKLLKFWVLLFFGCYAPSQALSQVTDIIALKKLTDRSSNDNLGRSVAVSGDIMVVGAEDAVSVFYRNKGGTNNWGFVKKLTGDYGAYNFGCSVSVSGDVIVVGSSWDNNDSAGNNYINSAGSAYVFHRNSGGTDNWGFIKKLTGKGTNGRYMNDEFGYSVSISKDVIVVGARGQRYDSAGNNVAVNAGAAYVFYRNSGGTDNWGFVKKLTGKGTNGRIYNDEFGYSVSISGDVIVVGACGQRFDSAGNNVAVNAGAAYVFYRNSGGTNNWGFVKKLIGSGPNGRNIDDEFGTSVSISDDVIVVGANYHDYDSSGNIKSSNAGAAFVFYRNNGGSDNWGFVKKLTRRNSGDFSCFSVSVSGDLIIVGAHGNGYLYTGAAYVFNRNSGGSDNWGFVKKLTGNGYNGIHTYDVFGKAVSISGNVIVVGALSHDYDSLGGNISMDAGAAFVFQVRGLCYAQSFISLNACNIYKSPSGKYTWTTSGTYKDTLINSKGCDSIITVTLTINNTTASSISPVVCNTYKSPSGKYTWTTSGTYKDTIPNVDGCDSVITVTLTINNTTASSISSVVCYSYKSPSGKYTWTTSGTYKDTLVNSKGCDSIITVTLTINSFTTSSLSSVVCNSYKSPSGNYIWTTSGTYHDTIPNTNGCDSIITIKLTVNRVNTDVTITGAVITSDAVSALYKWLDCGNSYSVLAGEISQTFNVKVNGIYAVEVTQNSCIDTSTCYRITNVGVIDAIHESKLFVYPNPAQNIVSVQANQIQSVKLLDINGKEIPIAFTIQPNGATADISMLENGVYFIVTETAHHQRNLNKLLICK